MIKTQKKNINFNFFHLNTCSLLRVTINISEYKKNTEII